MFGVTREVFYAALYDCYGDIGQAWGNRASGRAPHGARRPPSSLRYCACGDESGAFGYRGRERAEHRQQVRGSWGLHRRTAGSGLKAHQQTNHGRRLRAPTVFFFAQ